MRNRWLSMIGLLCSTQSVMCSKKTSTSTSTSTNTTTSSTERRMATVEQGQWEPEFATRTECGGACEHFRCIAASSTAVLSAQLSTQCAPSLETTNHQHQMQFSLTATQRERANYANACCYMYRTSGLGRPLRSSKQLKEAPSVTRLDWSIC